MELHEPGSDPVPTGPSPCPPLGEESPEAPLDESEDGSGSEDSQEQEPELSLSLWDASKHNPHSQLVRSLIASGADVNAMDANSWTPLHTAAYWGQEDVCDVLVHAPGVNLEARNKHGETPLHLAAKWPHDKAADALVRGGSDPNARNRRGRTPLHTAALFARRTVLERLIAAGGIEGRRATWASAGLGGARRWHGSPPSSRLHGVRMHHADLLSPSCCCAPCGSAGGDINATDNDLATPLHLAVRPTSVIEMDLVMLIIRSGANLNAKDVHGSSPVATIQNAQVRQVRVAAS